MGPNSCMIWIKSQHFYACMLEGLKLCVCVYFFFFLNFAPDSDFSRSQAFRVHALVFTLEVPILDGGHVPKIKTVQMRSLLAVDVFKFTSTEVNFIIKLTI